MAALRTEPRAGCEVVDCSAGEAFIRRCDSRTAVTTFYCSWLDALTTERARFQRRDFKGLLHPTALDEIDREDNYPEKDRPECPGCGLIRSEPTRVRVNPRNRTQDKNDDEVPDREADRRHHIERV